MKFIQVHKWVNANQHYSYVGNLICDSTQDGGAVSFHYENSYIQEHGASLDPKNLNIEVAHVFSEPEGNGAIPLFFTQFLPGEYASTQLAKLYPEWDGYSPFEKLKFSSNFFGDHHSIQLNSHKKSQNNSMLCDPGEVHQLLRAVTNYNPSAHEQALVDFPLFAICGTQGARPKFEYAEEGGRRWFAKPNSNPFYDESAVRVIASKLSALATIDTVETSFSQEMAVAVQANFKQAFFPGEEQHQLLKFNAVPFDILCNTPARLLTYDDIATVIRQYSADVSDDIDQLHLRALFDASINSTRNGLDNFFLVDIGVNKWRLAPNFSSLPNPNTSDKFDVPFTHRLSSRSLFTPDDQFALNMGERLGLGIESAIRNWKFITSAIESLPTHLKDFEDGQTQHIFEKALSPHNVFRNDIENNHTLEPE